MGSKHRDLMDTSRDKRKPAPLNQKRSGGEPGRILRGSVTYRYVQAPLRRDLPDDTATAVALRVAALGGGAVEFAARVKGHVTSRIFPIGAFKVVQRGVRPGRLVCACQLENGAKGLRAAAPRCAIEIT